MVKVLVGDDDDGAEGGSGGGCIVGALCAHAYNGDAAAVNSEIVCALTRAGTHEYISIHTAIYMNICECVCLCAFL